MKTLKEYLSEHENDFISKGKQNSSSIAELFLEIQFEPAPLLKDYLLNYGFIACGSVEFYGVGIPLSSRLHIITKTKTLRENFLLPTGFVIIEDLDDGLCVLCDQHDNIYEFSYFSVPKSISMNLEEYMIKRIKDVI